MSKVVSDTFQTNQADHRHANKQRLINLSAFALSICWLALIAFSVRPDMDDFTVQWQAAVNLLRSGDPYTTLPGYSPNELPFHDPITGVRKIWYLYPPFFAFFLQPLALLPAEAAKWVWFGLNSAALYLLIWVSIRASGSQLARRYWGVVALAGLLAPPMRLTLQLGQVSIMLTLVMVAGIALARARPGLSGWLLALASLIKLYPGFLGLYYLLRGARKIIGWSILAAAVICLLPAIPYGLTPYRAFLGILAEENYYPYSAEFNISILGFTERLFVNDSYAVPLIEAPLLSRALAAIMIIGVLVACYSVVRRLRPDDNDILHASAWLCGMLLLTPANGYYNLVALLLPCLAILAYVEHYGDRRLRAWLIIATTLVCVPPAWTEFSPWLYQRLHIGWGVLLLTPAFYGLVLYFVLLVRLTRRAAADSPVT